MLTGIELPPDRPELTDADRAALGIIRPAVVKVRFHEPDYLRSIAQLLPGVRFISRPESEGYDADAMIAGYRATIEGFTAAGLLSRLIAHEVANEPNHPDGPYGASGASQYRDQLAAFFTAIGTPQVGLSSPGLVRYVNVAAWATMLDAFPWSFRGVHCYWQGPDVAGAVQDALAQAGRRGQVPVLVTEFGDSSERDRPDIRSVRCADAVDRFANADVLVAIQFILRAPGWEFYQFPAAVFKAILSAAPAETKPPSEETMNKQEVSVYFEWALARVKNSQDPYDEQAFRTHLQAIGADGGRLTRYGWPKLTLDDPKA